MLLAMETARDDPGDYGERFQGVGMAFDVTEQEEGEDYYTITLSFSPEGDFMGTPGREQFFIAKEGRTAHRQVRRRPRSAGELRFPVVPVALGLVTAVVVAVIGVVLFAGGGGDDSDSGDASATLSPVSVSAPAQAQAQAPTEPSESPGPTATGPAARPTAVSTFVPLEAGRFQSPGADATRGWTESKSGVASTVELVAGTRRFGSSSVRLEVSSIPRFYAEVRQDIPVNPGEVWSIAVWGLRMDPFTGAHLNLAWLDAGREPISTVDQQFSREQRWAYVTIQDQSAPPGADCLRFSVRCESSAISPCGETFTDGAMACKCSSVPSFPSRKNVLQNPKLRAGGGVGRQYRTRS